MNAGRFNRYAWPGTYKFPTHDMDKIEPEGKRPRLGSYSSSPCHTHWMQPQPPPPPPPQEPPKPPSHPYANHASNQPPPPQERPKPPSHPYDNHAYNQPPPPPHHNHPDTELRGLPEPPPHGYPHSGYNTPALNLHQSHVDAAHAGLRLPNDPSHGDHFSRMSVADAYCYPPSYLPNHPGPPVPAYHLPFEAHQMNRAPHSHPVTAHHNPLPAPSPPLRLGMSYAPPPVTTGWGHLGAGGSFGGPSIPLSDQQPRRKQARATQVQCASGNGSWERGADVLFRLVTHVGTARQNVMKGGLRANFAKKIARHACIARCNHKGETVQNLFMPGTS